MVVVVMVVVVCCFVLAQQHVVVDRRTGLVDDRRVLQYDVERAVVTNLRDQLADRIVLLVGLAHLVGLLASPHRDSRILGVQLVVGDFDALGEHHGTQREIDLHGLHRLFLQCTNELVCGLAGHR